ncbi:hypothetical protein ES703_71396 [subsurface metagenome]
MARLSIVLPTFRAGGLDVIKYSLLDQSFKDFELVLVDELYDSRKDMVRQYFKGINLRHIPPFRVNNYFSSATARNTGISCAEGELIVFTNDYTWLSSDCLQRHWNAYNTLKGKYAVTGIRKNMDGFKITNPNMLYAFGSEIQNKPDGRVIFVDDRVAFRGQRLLEYYEINPLVVYADNSSIPLEVALKLNGFDTHFDGGAGFLDIDFFTRATFLGYKALMDPDNITYEIKANYASKAGNFKTPKENEEYFNQSINAIRRGAKVVEADNPYSLRNLRRIFGDAERQRTANRLPVF